MHNVTAPARMTGTALGMLAIALWGAAHGLMRLMSEAFGPTAGAALMYSVGTLVLIATHGWPQMGRFPRRYLLVGGVLFVAYEVSLALALGLAVNRRQVIEVSLINYLWPCLTALLAVVFGGLRAGWVLVPGMAMSLGGVFWIVNGAEGFSLAALVDNVRANPLPYGLAASAAWLWALYCFFARRLARGTDAIVPFFAATSVVLWVKFALSAEPMPSFGAGNVGLLVGTALVLSLGHAAWNKALGTGNLLVLAAASYATPVLSSMLSSLILATPLSLSFWQGVLLVTGGSLLCWMATRRG